MTARHDLPTDIASGGHSPRASSQAAPGARVYRPRTTHEQLCLFLHTIHCPALPHMAKRLAVASCFVIYGVLGTEAALLARQLGIDVIHQTDCDRKSQVGDVISVHYNGTLEDGRLFDSSHKRNAPIAFTLGVGQVIAGWDQGLLDMCPGDERLLTIPPELAYGARSVGVIPAQSTLSRYTWRPAVCIARMI